MKRDMELVRAILTSTEAASGPYNPADLVPAGWSMREIANHVELLSSHRLIDAAI